MKSKVFDLVPLNELNFNKLIRKHFNSRLIVSLTQPGLIDEYQLCVHPVILGKGLPPFKNIKDKIILKLIKTKPFNSGAIVLLRVFVTITT